MHQAYHQRRTLASQLATHKQPVLRAELPWFDQQLDEVFVDGHGAVIEVLRQRLSGVQALVDRLSDLAAIAHLRAMQPRPHLEELVPQRLAHLLPGPVTALVI